MVLQFGVWGSAQLSVESSSKIPSQEQGIKDKKEEFVPFKISQSSGNK